MMKKYLAWKKAELDNPSVACASDAPSVSSAAGGGSSLPSVLLPHSSSLVSSTTLATHPALSTVNSDSSCSNGHLLHAPRSNGIQPPQIPQSPLQSLLPTGTLAAASHLAALQQQITAALSLPSSTLAALLSNQIQANNPALVAALQRVAAASSGALADSASLGGGVLPAAAADVAATLAAMGGAPNGGGNGDSSNTSSSSSATPNVVIPDPPSILGAAGSPSASLLTSGGPSAFSLVAHHQQQLQQQAQQAQQQQQQQQAALAASQLLSNSGVLSAAALYPQLMCFGGGLLEKIVPILRNSQMASGAAGFKPLPTMDSVKPLPTADTRTDLSRYKLREPRDWTAQDVVSWMLDTSRRMQIPFEDVNMTKFAGLPGITLMNSTEADWIANDPVYGRTFFREFHDLITGRANTAGDRALEDYMRKLREEELQHPSTSFLAPNQHNAMQPPMTPAAHEALEQVKMRMNQANTLASTLSAALSPSMGLNSLHASLSPQSPLLIQSLQQNKQLSPLTSTELLMSKYSLGHHLGPASVLGHNSHGNDYDSDSDDSALHGVNDKIRKNKDGKPRKRSQHSKGNKLWEFIRDALKDPATCPSIVRWEDPHEGVFRIVESERLARLWGERKNNQKMTYEKLSRAMRYYYNTKILLPVSGRRLVYKFGPSAFGWNAEGGPAPAFDSAAAAAAAADHDSSDEEGIEEDCGDVVVDPASAASAAAAAPPQFARVSVIAHNPRFM